MTKPKHITRTAIMYDALLSILYAWSVFQAYSYDAKTQTTGIFIYIVVYGGFTLLIRSPLGVLMMNLLSIVTLPWIFSAPLLQQAGSYFSFQPFVGIFATVVIALIQAGLSVLLITRAQESLTKKHQYAWSAVIGLAFTIVLTIFVSFVPMKPW